LRKSRYKKEDPNQEMVSFGPWTFRIQKDRSNINDYFEEGDLSCLFDESEVVD